MAKQEITPEVGALVLYAYELGGNTRLIAAILDVDHDMLTTALARANHVQALVAAGITEDEWRADHGKR